MDLAKHITLRYRDDGHARFQLPSELCRPGFAERLAGELSRVEGIYRVDLSPRQRKLSVRYIEHICSFEALTLALFNLVNSIEWIESEAATPPRGESMPTLLRKRMMAANPAGWARAKMQEARETVTAMGILARRESVRERALSLASEDNVIHLLNDVLVVFLIKLHWHLITQHWIRRPWEHRYEWLAGGYMIYLLVRSKRPASDE